MMAVVYSMLAANCEALKCGDWFFAMVMPFARSNQPDDFLRPIIAFRSCCNRALANIELKSWSEPTAPLQVGAGHSSQHILMHYFQIFLAAS